MAIRNASWQRSEMAIQQWLRILAAACREMLKSNGLGSAVLLRGGTLRLCGCLLLASGFVTSDVSPLYAQASPTASRLVDLQAGATFNLGNSDYQGASTLKGFGFYTTFDFRHHLGVEADFHQLNDPGSQKSIYERTYEIGPRYVMHFGRFAPYTKLMVGRGVFNFPPSPSNPSGGAVANLAYNIWAVGVGADYHLRPSINVRADYEFQRWCGFPPNGLSPGVLSFGVAYHFH